MKIFKTKAVYSIMATHFAHNWGNYLFLTQTPSYLNDVFKFNIKSVRILLSLWVNTSKIGNIFNLISRLLSLKNGLISSIPYIASSIAISMSGLIADVIIGKKWLTRTWARRVFNGVGLFLPAGCVIALSFIECTNVVAGVVLLTLGVAFEYEIIFFFNSKF